MQAFGLVAKNAKPKSHCLMTKPIKEQTLCVDLSNPSDLGHDARALQGKCLQKTLSSCHNGRNIDLSGRAASSPLLKTKISIASTYLSSNRAVKAGTPEQFITIRCVLSMDAPDQKDS